LVDNVVQSILVEPGTPGGYWAKMLPSVRPRCALLLGLGGGTLARLLALRFGPLPIVGIDDDAELLALAQSRFELGQEGLEIRLADAFAFVARCSEQFDYVAVDLYRSGALDRRVLGRPFLRSLKRLATPGAEIAFNLNRRRNLEPWLARIERVLVVRTTERVGENTVVRAGVR
jgi:spermidine synthase